MEAQNQPVKIFYSYAHKDEMFRDELETHLKILQRNNLVSEWHDRKIMPGLEWNKEIDDNIGGSDIILLLISSDFIASDYCWNVEVKKSLDMHDSGRARVIPIILRPTEWGDTPFSKLQALPKNAEPISKWESRDEAWIDVIKGITKVAKDVRSKKARAKHGEYTFLSMKELLTSSVERIDYLFSSDTSIPGVTSGFSELDKITAGWHRSELILLASRPSMGKTTFALNLAEAAAIKIECPVAFFSLDMTGDKLSTKLMSSIGRVDQGRVWTGQLFDDDWPRLTSAVGILAEAPIYIDDSSVVSTDLIRKKAMQLSTKHGLGMIIIDHMQLISPKDKETRKSINYSSIAHELKALAKEINVPIVLLSQLDSQLELRANKRPCLADLGRWHGVDEMADVVLFIYRDEVYDPDSLERGTAEIIVAKNKIGPIGAARLAFLGKYSRFENMVPRSKNNNERS